MDRSTTCVAVLIAAVIVGACNYKSAGSSYSGTDGGREPKPEPQSKSQPQSEPQPKPEQQSGNRSGRHQS